MAENNSYRLIRAKLVYAKTFVELESLYGECDKDLALIAPDFEQVKDHFAQAESQLAMQRSRIVDAGGYIIDTTFGAVINPPSGESIVSNLIEDIKNKIEQALPNTTDFDIEEGGEDVPPGSHVLYVFTDRKLITKVLKIINDATGNAYELTPFRHTKIMKEHQRIAGLSTIESCKAFIDRYKHL